MSNRIDSQIDDIEALMDLIERNRRRNKVEYMFGPIKTVCQCPPIPYRGFDYEAHFDRYLDLDMPSWARGFGATEIEALNDLLDNCQEKYDERVDEMRQDELQRRAGCND